MSVKMTWNDEEVKRRAEKLAGKSSFEIGLIVQGYAKSLAPYVTGRLRGSIQVSSSTGQKTAPTGEGAVASDTIAPPKDKFETFVGTPVEYGPYQEYGTVKASAQPFLRPALEMAKGRALAIVQSEAKNQFAEYLTTRDIFSQASEAFTE